MSSLATILLAAGQGTRMRSRRPKVLHEIAGDPMILYPLELADQLGSKAIVCVLGHGLAEIKARFQEERFQTKARLQIIRQVPQRGTGDAVSKTKAALAKHKGDVLILYGDVPFIGLKTLKQLRARHRRGAYTLSVLSTWQDDPSGYGRIIRNDDDTLLKIVEEGDASRAEKQIQEVNTGIYLLKKDVLFKALRKVKQNRRKKEIFLTDIVAVIAGEGGKVGAHCIAHPMEAMGINSRAHLAEANLMAREQIHYYWMERGVEFLDPATAAVDRSVKLAPDVTVGAGVVMRGHTRIKRGSVIETGSILVDATVGEEVLIKPYSVVEASRVDNGAQIGPFAHLRPGSRVGAAAKVGNFVELKKTHLAAGAKANHLSYLGDADIGPESNIGAGTITCNYDGMKKFRTKVGARSFIGSDTQLIAPVTVGTDTYVGAGSTITKNVPAGSLAVSRSDQINISGWTRRNRRSRSSGV